VLEFALCGFNSDMLQDSLLRFRQALISHGFSGEFVTWKALVASHDSDITTKKLMWSTIGSFVA
jgi:hypothetical protein